MSAPKPKRCHPYADGISNNMKQKLIVTDLLELLCTAMRLPTV